MKPKKAIEKVREEIEDNSPVDKPNTLLLVSEEVREALMEYAKRHLDPDEVAEKNIMIEDMPVIKASYLEGEEVKLRSEER